MNEYLGLHRFKTSFCILGKCKWVYELIWENHFH